MFFGPRPTGDVSVSNCGCVPFGGDVFSTRTRRSNHAACPVIGSEFDQRSPSPLGGNSSEIKWFKRNPLFASGASGSNAHAPRRLPIAFQVQIVFSFNAAISATGTVISPLGELTLAQSPSINSFSCMTLVGKYIGFIP